MHIPFPVTYKSINLLALVFIGFGLYMVSNNFKDKSSFENRSGHIVYLAESYHQLPLRYPGKYRYLGINTFPYIIEIFVSHDPSDFVPKHEQIDKLKIGDSITVYYKDGAYIAKEHILRTIKFIDKDGVSFYEDGNGDIFGGVLICGISICLFPLAYYAKKKGKIV